MLVEKILPRAANIFQILQIPILSIFWKKEKKCFDWNDHFFFDPRIIFDRHDPRETSIGSKLELLARERAGGWRRVDCVSRQAAPLRARCAVTRHAPFTPIATNTCITAAVSKFAPPSTLTHCPPPPLHSGHFTWNDNHPRQNDPIASRNNIAKISYNSEKLWTDSSSFFYFKNLFAILSFEIRKIKIVEFYLDFVLSRGGL